MTATKHYTAHRASNDRISIGVPWRGEVFATRNMSDQRPFDDRALYDFRSDGICELHHNRDGADIGTAKKHNSAADSLFTFRKFHSGLRFHAPDQNADFIHRGLPARCNGRGGDGDHFPFHRTLHVTECR